MVWRKVSQKVIGKKLRLVISRMQCRRTMGSKMHILVIDCHLKSGDSGVLG